MNVNDQVWTVQEDPVEDPMVFYREPARVFFPHFMQNKLLEQRKCIDYFNCSMPIDIINGIRAEINSTIHKHLRTKNSEVMALLGLRIAQSLDPIRGNISDYWLQKNPYVNTTFTPRNYGDQHGMSYNRFRNLMSAFSIIDPNRKAPFTDEEEVIVICHKL